MTDRATGSQANRSWLTFFAAFAALYLVIAVILMLGGISAAQAWGTPAAILVVPALGMGVVRYRKTRTGRL
ncbi:hypothetical protein [Streptomyces wuyuanensis]|uniref:hypothetical protein n=1 Tax=Streptomyces wuyuanensis TaxID=1196353 RepID=UPI00379273F7